MALCSGFQTCGASQCPTRFQQFFGTAVLQHLMLKSFTDSTFSIAWVFFVMSLWVGCRSFPVVARQQQSLLEVYPRANETKRTPEETWNYFVVIWEPS